MLQALGTETQQRGKKGYCRARLGTMGWKGPPATVSPGPTATNQPLPPLLKLHLGPSGFLPSPLFQSLPACMVRNIALPCLNLFMAHFYLFFPVLYLDHLFLPLVFTSCISPVFICDVLPRGGPHCTRSTGQSPLALFYSGAFPFLASLCLSFCVSAPGQVQ